MEMVLSFEFNKEKIFHILQGFLLVPWNSSVNAVVVEADLISWKGSPFSWFFNCMTDS